MTNTEIETKLRTFFFYEPKPRTEPFFPKIRKSCWVFTQTLHAMRLIFHSFFFFEQPYGAVHKWRHARGWRGSKVPKKKSVTLFMNDPYYVTSDSMSDIKICCEIVIFFSSELRHQVIILRTQPHKVVYLYTTFTVCLYKKTSRLICLCIRIVLSKHLHYS